MNGTAVGFMSLSTDVDLEALEKCFELEPFNGLKKNQIKKKLIKKVGNTGYKC